MKVLIALAAAASVMLCLPAGIEAAEGGGGPSEKPGGAGEQSAAPKCLKAAVNPVTGHAICVEPRGAPVDPPSAAAFNRPCKKRAHDDEAFTVYERYSGC